MTLPDVGSFFLSERLKESREVVKEVAARSKQPLIIQFSAGCDSMAMLGLVREVNAYHVCAYMATGLEFQGFIQFVKDTCNKLGEKLVISNPSMHKGNLFKRIEKFHTFPLISTTWCCRDLKLRPQKKMLRETFGKGPFYKLEGVRRFESARRAVIYKSYSEVPVREDGEHRGSYEVFPIINWTDEDVRQYLEESGLPTTSLYRQFGISGCSWCPFYGPDIYRRVLVELPTHYDRIIDWEEKLGIPSVPGKIYLRDIKKEVLSGGAPVTGEVKLAKKPCTIMWEGKLRLTCDVFGHHFIDGECFRCGTKEDKSE